MLSIRRDPFMVNLLNLWPAGPLSQQFLKKTMPLRISGDLSVLLILQKPKRGRLENYMQPLSGKMQFTEVIATRMLKLKLTSSFRSWREYNRNIWVDIILINHRMLSPDI